MRSSADRLPGHRKFGLLDRPDVLVNHGRAHVDDLLAAGQLIQYEITEVTTAR